MDNMPSHDSILEFSNALAGKIGYQFTADRRDSRVALISKDPSTAKIDFDEIFKAGDKKMISVA